MSVACSLFSRASFRPIFQKQSFHASSLVRSFSLQQNAPFVSTHFTPRVVLATARTGNPAGKPRIAYKAAGIVGMGLGLSWFSLQTVFCEPPPVAAAPPPPPPLPQPLPPPPPSQVNFYELTFGTVCGVCAGVFVKKGAKALAFVLGGVYVLLQYLTSLSYVRVDWGRMSTSFEKRFYTTEPRGGKRPPTIVSLLWWCIDFLTADFQQRASFIAGFALGLRIG